ncbi:hypothetical protein GTP46_02775 [Duganella sp. FT135W]|uniref:Imm33-like domain-containing protein n=1 Tax=Duganella flavida TaxID=2692175 RepID=A0A6L8K311_9BURK|nr:hypothetical protein [Duganella flavida]MYM21570.1 hypothetical protein [Duganella flavida]
MIRQLITTLLALGAAQTASAETYLTTKCAQFGQPEFQINVMSSSIPRADVDWALSTLEGMVASGEKFKAGETMQLGWMLTKLQAGDKGQLIVTEPDMKSFPIVFVDSVDSTLKHLRSQKDTVESVLAADALAFPSLIQAVVVHVNYDKSPRLMLERSAPNGRNSGLKVIDLNDKTASPNNYTLISLYQLAKERPDLVKFFAIPPGVQATIDGKISFKKNGQALPIKPGSFIELLNRQM